MLATLQSFRPGNTCRNNYKHQLLQIYYVQGKMLGALHLRYQ